MFTIRAVSGKLSEYAGGRQKNYNLVTDSGEEGRGISVVDSCHRTIFFSFFFFFSFHFGHLVNVEGAVFFIISSFSFPIIFEFEIRVLFLTDIYLSIHSFIHSFTQSFMKEDDDNKKRG